MALQGEHHFTIHGHKKGGKMTPEYAAWNNMLARCYRPSARSFPLYGGKGIAVCERWRESFSAFLDDMGQRPAAGMSLDRVDGTKDYTPENCRWASAKEQSLNRDCVRWITHAGKTLTLGGWAKVTGVKRSTLAQRLHVYGWPIEKTLKEYKEQA